MILKNGKGVSVDYSWTVYELNKNNVTWDIRENFEKMRIDGRTELTDRMLILWSFSYLSKPFHSPYHIK